MTEKVKKEKKAISQHQLYMVKPKVWRKLKRISPIDDTYKRRARQIGFYSMLTSPLMYLQDRLKNRRIKAISFEGKEPVFILGHWRSGTTFLHYLMAKDPALGYLCNYQAYVFNIALLSSKRVRYLTKPFFPKTRPMDNVKLSPFTPAEEDQPLSTFSVCTAIQTFFFPQDRVYFDKYNIFKNVSAKEKAQWQKDYTYLVKSIALYNNNKRLVLKSPHNTSRVKELLELFPNAKFVFIHRDPYVTYNSMVHLFNKVIKTQLLQDISDDEIKELIIYMFRETLNKYIAERDLIPKGNLVEIAYDDLDIQPMEQMEMIYSKLGLSGFETAKPEMQDYLESVKGYKKNSFKDIPDDLKQRLQSEWKIFFETFGY